MSHDLSWGRRLLMCPPEHFDVSYAINPWMNPAVPVDRELVQRQWDALVAALGAAGAEVELLDAQPGLPDLVFTANLGIVDGETFVPARMRHRERRDEAAHAIRWFAARGFAIETLGGDVIQEGAGDALPFGDTLLAGHDGRSTQSAYVELADLVAGPIAAIELADPRFYHVDIVFSPLDARTAVYAPSALTAEGARTIERLVPDAIALTSEEAASFCANCVAVGRTVVMAACTPRLERELRARGFEPVVVDVSEFLKAGGGPRCLTLALDVRLGERLDERFTAHNYQPLAITVTSAEGVWVTDDRGRRYLDALSAYSALNFGHRHPALVAAAHEQLDRVTLTSRAFGDDPLARDGYGPFTPGFIRVPFGDAAALTQTLHDDADVVAFLFEPVQGEAGVVVAPDGYLREARRLCSANNVLMIADEIQSGLGRTGRTFACDHEDVVPDVYVLGKALGGGIVALSAIVGDDDVLGVFGPGSHGSTFGANPLACAVGRAVLDLLQSGEPQEAAARTGARVRAALDAAAPAALQAIRSHGLWFGLDLDPAHGSARAACERLLARGVLAKDTHAHTIRLAPPLQITDAEADWLLERLLASFQPWTISIAGSSPSCSRTAA